MPGRFVKRREHTRLLRSGRCTHVRETRVFCEAVGERSNSYIHSCPTCRASILSIHMKNGGWLHVGAAVGMRRIKHACLHLGEGLSRRRDDSTPDLFEMSIYRLSKL
jgi:hypothetical protein